MKEVRNKGIHAEIRHNTEVFPSDGVWNSRNFCCAAFFFFSAMELDAEKKPSVFLCRWLLTSVTAVALENHFVRFLFSGPLPPATLCPFLSCCRSGCFFEAACIRPSGARPRGRATHATSAITPTSSSIEITMAVPATECCVNCCNEMWILALTVADILSDFLYFEELYTENNVRAF